MDGEDEEEGERHGISLGEVCHGRRPERRWMATTEKMDDNIAFPPGKGVMDGDKKEDGWRRRKRWIATKKMDGHDAVEGTKHGLSLGNERHGR